MNVDVLDKILSLYNKEIKRLSLEMSIARNTGDMVGYTKLCERHDELILLFHGTIDIINSSKGIY